jgi:ubiquinone/menaquinone biosynthesis C-methylase UbiE
VPRHTAIRSIKRCLGIEQWDSSSVAGNERRSRATRPRDTSWERVAGWYDGWVGSGGSRYHQRVAIPAVLGLLRPKPGEAILDIGAGQGVLAPAIASAGARYTGVDASTRLVDAARRRHGQVGRFLVADARHLNAVRDLRRGSQDAAVFMLSIQDMAPLDEVLSSIARALRPVSRIVILMTHPAFRVPRHSGWGFDPGRKLVFRRVDSYLTEMAVPMKSLRGEPPTRSFHRPIGAYVTELARLGFAVDALEEIADLPAGDRPRREIGAETGNPDIPLFLALRAVRCGARTASPLDVDQRPIDRRSARR